MGNAFTDACYHTVFEDGIINGIRVEGAFIKAVAYAICYRTDNEKGVCYPSIRDIAEHAQVSKRTAIRVVQWLERIRLFVVSRSKVTKGKRRGSNRYMVREVEEIRVKRNFTTAKIKVFKGWTNIAGAMREDSVRVPETPTEGSGAPETPSRCPGDTNMVSGGHHPSALETPSRCPEDTNMVPGGHHPSAPETPSRCPEDTNMVPGGHLNSSYNSSRNSSSKNLQENSPGELGLPAAEAAIAIFNQEPRWANGFMPVEDELPEPSTKPTENPDEPCSADDDLDVENVIIND